MKKISLLIGLVIVLLSSQVLADGFIIPIPRPVPPHEPMPPMMSIKYHHVDIKINDQIAETFVDQVFKNNYHRDLEGTYIFPIPEDASISKFSMYVGNEEIRGKVLDKDEARKIYEDIVRQRKDPALLEYYNDGMFKARVYPIPAHGETRIKLGYSEILNLSGTSYRYKYVLGTEKFSKDPLESVKLSIELESKSPIKSIFSPTHDIRTERISDHKAKITYFEEGTRPNKDFVLYYTVSDKDIGFSLLTHYDEKEGGFFLGMVSPKVELSTDKKVKKNVIFVLDTSGSMKGKKIEQARGALSFCLNSLNKGDRFNIIDFDDRIESFKSELVAVNSFNLDEALEFVRKTKADGGTDINSALLTGLEQITSKQRPNFIIFLTDGLPTVGQTKLKDILKNVDDKNLYKTRIFVFGVGYDVNTHLLDKLASENHAASEYVSPDEDIEIKVSHFFTKISHPILTDLRLKFNGIETSQVYPQELPDLFQGSQLIILGKFKGQGNSNVILSGLAENNKKTYEYRVDFVREKDKNEFVPLLWATRRIGYLIDQIRLYGKNKELVDEIVTLSKKYGIITEYTSFLIDADPTVPHQELAERAEHEISKKASMDVGKGAVQQARNLSGMRVAAAPTQGYYDAEGKMRRVTEVMQAGKKSFFKKGDVWVDSEFEGKGETLKIERFSPAYFKLISLKSEIGKYLALGDNVIFTLNGTAVEISDQGKTDLTKEELNRLF
jgi:Ca-activated chloride channel family protein